MVKEWVLKSLKAPPLGIYKKVIIQFCRGLCGSCYRTSMAKTEWIHPKLESMTCGYAEIAGRLMEEMTCEAVGRVLFSPSMMMWQLNQYRMETMLQFLQLPEGLDVSYLAADEVHYRTEEVKNRKGLFAKRHTPKFITNLFAPLAGKVLFNAMGRDSKALEESLSSYLKVEK